MTNESFSSVEPTVSSAVPTQVTVKSGGLLSSVTFWMVVSGILGVSLISVVFVSWNTLRKYPTLLPTPSVTATISITPSATVSETPTVTPSGTVSVTPSVTPKADQNIQTANPNVMQFTSEDLGITFKYAKKSNGQNIAIKRDGTTVYVYPTSMNYKSGQYVRVFTKDVTLTMANDMQGRFLAAYSITDCLNKTYNKQGLPAGYETRTISTPPATDLEDLEKKVAKCPPTYTTSNGISYFEGSNVRDDRYVFLSIGQYSIGGDSAQNSWQDTLRFIAQ